VAVAGAKLNRILEETGPGAVYLTERDGHRCALLIVDLAEASRIPGLSEPWFLTFGADVGFHPVMSREDLQQAGLDKLGEEWA